jgi:exonuclease SbcC
MEIQSLLARIQSYENECKKKQQACEAAAQAVLKIKTEIETLETQLAESEPIDLDAVRKEKTVTEEEQRQCAESTKTFAARLSQNTNALRGIVKTEKRVHEMEERYKWMKPLSDTANGEISGKEKIRLETYVQIIYFDRIIARANVRMMQMTHAQYEFKRRSAGGGLRSQSGLDLNIINHHKGFELDVKMLSGGESFIAALSLALGLSDEIQSHAGGVRLDSMFIDEGFGTLDEQSLAQVMKALLGISQHNRLIGIISHVGEMKEKISRQIVVKKDRSLGSFAEVRGGL